MSTTEASGFDKTDMNFGDQTKRIKELEKRCTKLRNENQTFSTQLDKATRLLEREIGEVVDIDQLTKDDSNWKGRAQKIEVLRAQVKKYKMYSAQSITDDSLSVISEAPTVFSGKITNAEKNLTQLNSNKARELETLRQ